MESLMRKRNLLVGVLFVVLLAALGIGQSFLERAAEAQSASGAQAPMFEVDPFWPKPLPNHWLLGSTIGVSVDGRDHVWIIHRGAMTMNRNENSAGDANPIAEECCVAAPPVLEFDQEGNLVGHWGGEDGPGYTWPTSNHGITVDPMDNVWIGGNGAGDAHILKFTRTGEFIAQFGQADARRSGTNPEGEPTYAGASTATDSFGRVAKINFDAAANEAYVADGYLNKRVAVIDMETGEFKRIWGAYGNEPDDTNLGPYDPNAPPAQQFRNPVHCAMPSNDGLVYVCDRPNDRIQVFQKDGTFVDEMFIAKQTLGAGSVWDIAFSRDPEQTYIYLADGVNEKVYIIDRESLEILTSFGDGGRQPSQFFGVHSIAVDSSGNIYTTETYEGKRIQKFINRGMGPVTEMDQEEAWPTTSGQ